jgi:hypothetical protein
MSGIKLVQDVKLKEKQVLQIELNNNKEIFVLNILEDATDLVLNLVPQDNVLF